MRQSFNIILHNFGNAFFGKPNFCAIRHQLQAVTVSCYDNRIKRTSFCKCANQIVRLVPFKSNNIYFHSLKHFLYNRKLQSQVLGHWFTLCLIAVIHFFSESRCFYVKCSNYVSWFCLRYNFKQHIDIAVHRISRSAVNSTHWRQSIKSTIKQTI